MQPPKNPIHTTKNSCTCDITAQILYFQSNKNVLYLCCNWCPTAATSTELQNLLWWGAQGKGLHAALKKLWSGHQFSHTSNRENTDWEKILKWFQMNAKSMNISVSHNTFFWPVLSRCSCVYGCSSAVWGYIQYIHLLNCACWYKDRPMFLLFIS